MAAFDSTATSSSIPQTDPEKAFAERQRYVRFAALQLGRLGNKELLGPGGGVFARTLKEIPLSPEVRELIGAKEEKLSPAALIHALLKAKADLLWFGGIGHLHQNRHGQSNLDVGDRANDAVRINGAEVGARVVGRRRQSGRHATQAASKYARHAADASIPTPSTIPRAWTRPITK